MRHLPTLWNDTGFFDRFFDDFFVSARPTRPERSRFSPAVDVEETDAQYSLSFDLPGLKKDEIKIDLADHHLIVSGERTEETKDEKTKKVTERFYGKFQRSFQLPDNVDREKVDASYLDGVLKLTLPKSSKDPARTIRVQ